MKELQRYVSTCLTRNTVGSSLLNRVRAAGFHADGEILLRVTPLLGLSIEYNHRGCAHIEEAITEARLHETGFRVSINDFTFFSLLRLTRRVVTGSGVERYCRYQAHQFAFFLQYFIPNQSIRYLRESCVQPPTYFCPQLSLVPHSCEIAIATYSSIGPMATPKSPGISR